MFYKDEFDVYSFEFWAGAKDRVDAMNNAERQALSEHIEEVFWDCTPTATQINDFVWFDWDDIKEENGLSF